MSGEFDLVSTMERNSFELIIQEMAQQGRNIPAASEREVNEAFNLADALLEATAKMRKAIRDGGNVREQQSLLRITTAALFHSVRDAGREIRGKHAAISAAGDGKPIGFHALIVEVYADETFRVRIDSAALEYENGELARQINTSTVMPAREPRTADQAAQEVIVGARVLSQAIATTKIEVVPS